METKEQLLLDLVKDMGNVKESLGSVNTLVSSIREDQVKQNDVISSLDVRLRKVEKIYIAIVVIFFIINLASSFMVVKKGIAENDSLVHNIFNELLYNDYFSFIWNFNNII